MKDIIKYLLVNPNYLHKKYKYKIILFNLICDADINSISITKAQRSKYLRNNLKYFEDINSNYIMAYLFDYLIKYQMPNVEELYNVYQNELHRYMLIESLRVNTPTTLKYKNLDSLSIINICKITTHINTKNITKGLFYTTVDHLISLFNLYDIQVNNTLITWEEQGICLRINNNLIVILIDIFILLGQHPTSIVNYLLKWGRNERLKDLKLI